MKGFIKHIVLLVVMAGYLVVILGFVSKEEEKVTCNNIRIIINDSLDVQFVNSGMIKNILLRGGDKMAGKPFNDLDMQELENKIKDIRYIKRAEVYQTVDGELVVEISQRKPIVRVIDRSGYGFYIDNEGYIVPLSRNYTPYVMVVNGAIGERYRNVSNIFDSGQENNLLMDIYNMTKFIRSDEFWELIPRVGSQIIEFGKAVDMEEKFEKLWILYNEGFHNTGWNQYEKINLKYKNQAVCTKR
jgi:cell division protein FtsQ